MLINENKTNMWTKLSYLTKLPAYNKFKNWKSKLLLLRIKNLNCNTLKVEDNKLQLTLYFYIGSKKKNMIMTLISIKMKIDN